MKNIHIGDEYRILLSGKVDFLRDKFSIKGDFSQDKQGKS